MSIYKAAPILLIMIALCGCSKKSDTAVILDANGKHPAGWAVAVVGGLHPAAFHANQSSCDECHGSTQVASASGGISGVSCFSASRSGITCHPNGPSGHPAGWSAAGSHGSAAKAAAPGLSYCTGCHGTNYAGGAGKSCMTCHTTAPHPAAPWRGTTASGTTHTTTDQTNATECSRCHAGGARLTTPVSALTGATCFNNTLCHGVKSGHPAGWRAASSHGSSAKAAPSASQGFTYCTQCHGVDFISGTGTSCKTCHTTAPHPIAANWRSTGTITHTNTDVNNASVCSQCHNATQKNLTQPYQARFTPAGSFLAGTPGCFNGTLCHAGITNTSNCTVCHGPLSSTAFNSLAGVTAATDAKVGAHVKHLNAVIGSTVTCSECHTVPTSPAVSGTHRDGTVQVAFSTLAKTGGLAPTVSRDATSGALVCSNTYCHGASLSGGSNKTPRWNDTAYNVGCTTCHGYPPTTIRGGATHSTSTSCSGCHSHVNVTNNGFTPTGVALHINGSVEASGGSAHSVPNYNHQAGGTGSACTGCHTVGTATSAYPAATLGNAPDCRGCHKKAAPGVGCSSCHGDATGRPNGTAFPDKTGQHSRGAHNVACTVCHVLGTSAGTGATINHGPGNRGTNPNVVGPGFTTGIILSGGTKGTSPAASCNHNATLGGGCGNGEGTKSW